MLSKRRMSSDEDERLHLVGCRTYMFARPVPLKQNPKVSRGVEAPRGRSRRLMSLSCGDVPYRSTTDFGAKPTCRSSRARITRRRASRIKQTRRSRSSDASDALLLLSSQVSRHETVRRTVRARFSRTTKQSLFWAVTSGSCARIRFHDAAFVGPQSDTCLYWSVGKRGLTILVSMRRRLETARRFVFWFFSSPPERKNSDARDARPARKGALCCDDNTRGCLLVG